MLHKIIKITTPIVLISVLLFIAYSTYKKTQKSTTHPITVIPTNAAIILQLNDLAELNKILQASNAYSKLKNIKQIAATTTEAENLNNFLVNNNNVFYTNNLFVSFHKVSANKAANLFSVNFKSKEIKTREEIINLFSNDITTSKYDNKNIYFSETWNKYFSLHEDVLFFSENKMLLEDAIRTSNKETDNLFVNPLFSEPYKKINTSANINLMINYNNLIEVTSLFTNIKSKLSSFSGWAATDIKVKKNIILASGLSSFNNEPNNFTDIFQGQLPQEINILNILPKNTTGLFSISFNNNNKIYEDKNKLMQNDNEFWNWNKNRKTIRDTTGLDYNELIKETYHEAGIFNTSSNLSHENSYAYFNTKESIRASSLLQGMITQSTNYKNFQIHSIIDKSLTSNLFGEKFKTNTPFFTIINDYFIFGNSIKSLEYIIDNYASKNTLSKNKSFEKFSSYISNNVNLFIYLNLGKTAKKIQNTLINKENFSHNSDSIAKFTAFSIQMKSTKKKLIHNISLFYDQEYRESIKEEWYYSLDTTTGISPHFFHNHVTGEKMIIIQDKSNKLIALNSSGEKIWEKQINNQILGNITVIDNYQNKKKQALFNTKNQLYLIDRLGNIVDKFPKELPYSTSMGHYLYINNKKYRTLITGDDNYLYNLNEKWKKTLGWKYTKTANQINQEPIHFIVNGKDYILNATNEKIKLLSLRGTERTSFLTGYGFANNIQISQEGLLYGITTDNKLWCADITGNSNVLDISNLNNNTKILSYKDGYYIGNNNELVYINDNNIEETNMTLDSSIRNIAFSNGYVAITTNTSLYLIKNHKILDGFPIESDGLFNLSDINNNGKINVINIKNGLVYNYELTK